MNSGTLDPLNQRQLTILWSAWIGILLAIEIPAAANATPGDTLSEHVWALLNLPALSFIGAGLAGWLVWHFFSKASWR